MLMKSKKLFSMVQRLKINKIMDILEKYKLPDKTKLNYLE